MKGGNGAIFPSPETGLGLSDQAIGARKAKEDGWRSTGTINTPLCHFWEAILSLGVEEVDPLFERGPATVPADLSAGVKLEADAIQMQSSGSGGITTLLPVGLGSKNGDYSKVYFDSFQRIVVKNESVQTVLEDEAKIMQGIFNDTKAPCWAPDPTGTGVCTLK